MSTLGPRRYIEWVRVWKGDKAQAMTSYSSKKSSKLEFEKVYQKSALGLTFASGESICSRYNIQIYAL